jgi:hypothetical protein
LVKNTLQENQLKFLNPLQSLIIANKLVFAGTISSFTIPILPKPAIEKRISFTFGCDLAMIRDNLQI